MEAWLDREADASSRAEPTTAHPCFEEDASRCFTPANFAIVRQEIEAMGEIAVVDTMASSSDGSGDKVLHALGRRQARHCAAVVPWRRRGRVQLPELTFCI